MKCTSCGVREGVFSGGAFLPPNTIIELMPGIALCRECLNKDIEESERAIEDHRQSEMQ